MHLSPSETARRFGVTIKALRVYERHGLLTPLRQSAGSTRSRWRAYGPEQLARLHQILALKRLGLPLARIGEVLAGPHALDKVLALQADALVHDCKRLSQALALVRRAQDKLAAGQALSIDDLANLTKETSMPSRLTRQTFFHPALVPHQHKYFSAAEIEALGSREDLDQERDIAVFFGMVDELKTLRALGDCASPQALDLGRRWIAHGKTITRGDQEMAARMRNMVRDAFADPTTAAQMPFSADDLAFLQQILGTLRKMAG